MRVLLTGDTGFIGTNMKSLLQRENVEASGFSRKNGYDVFNKDQLRREVKKYDLVYHFAADAKPAESVLDPVQTLSLIHI